MTIRCAKALASVLKKLEIGPLFLCVFALRARMEIVNTLGELYAVIEMGSRIILYGYDVLGNLTLTRNSGGNETVITYNGLSQKIVIQDPGKGTLSCSYNALALTA